MGRECNIQDTRGRGLCRAVIVNVHHFISGLVNISLGVSAVFLTVRWSVGWSVCSGLHKGYILNSLRDIEDEELEVETG